MPDHPPGLAEWKYSESPESAENQKEPQEIFWKSNSEIVPNLNPTLNLTLTSDLVAFANPKLVGLTKSS